MWLVVINPLKADLNSICHLLALLAAHCILHLSRIRVKEADCIMFQFTIVGKAINSSCT
jgi:hypothetical protein